VVAAAELALPPAPRSSQRRIAIHCGLRVLQLWQGETLVKEYPAEIGKGIPKRRGGDHLTPVGDYEISWMASRNSSKGGRIVDGRSWCAGNRFVDAASGSPLERLWSASYGGDRAVVISINYPNAKEKALGYTGNCIHIHASAKHHEGALTTSHGCVHLFPKDAEELYEAVDVGVPVKILP
jgi:murein L,D-transpeptidase YafK